MTTYQPGQRIALEHTSDPYTDLRPGDTGTVRRHDQHLNTVDIDWDNGSRLSMCLDAGDRIQPLDPASTANPDASQATAAWAATLARLADAGTEAGRGVAEWWAQDTIGGRATGDVRATARRILAGIEDGDPAALDTLPTFTPPPVWADGRDTAELRYTEAAHDDSTPGQPPRWQDLTDEQRAETIDASREAFDTAVVRRVTELCHLAASPTGTDVSHLHSDRVRVGGVGVFAGDWAAGTGHVEVGFVGTLVDICDSWAVFTATREVAEAIVADRQQHRTHLRQSYQARGLSGDALARCVDTAMADLRFDGEDIIVDQRVMYGDPQAIERTSPDSDGRYTVGWGWCWQMIDPYLCDRLVGDVPEPGQTQQWVRLVHTPDLTVPHDRLKVVSLRTMPTHNDDAFIARLAVDNEFGGTIENHGNGQDTHYRALNSSRFNWSDLGDYVRASRHRGQVPTEELVLRALVDEYDLGRAVARAARVDATLVRLLDAAGNARDLLTVRRPTTPAHLDTLITSLADRPPVVGGGHWWIWSGSRWRFLAAAPAATQPPDPY